MIPRPVDTNAYMKNCELNEAPPVSSYLFATTRLPDCRQPARVMTSFRGGRLMYGGWSAEGVQFYNPTRWKEQVRQRIGAPSAPPILYIHGYNNSNLAALSRAAAIHEATDRQVIVLTWPSYDATTKYFWDEANAEWSSSDARVFFDELTRIRSDFTVIAHSMGNRLAMEMLKSWRLEHPGASPPIKRLIMAAPDVDRAWFIRAYGNGLGVPVTLYGSTKDQPLSASWRSHGYPRAGDLSKWVTGNDNDYPFDALDNIDVVDTSAVARRLGHADFIETFQGAADLCRVVNEKSTNVGRLRAGEQSNTWILLKDPQLDDCSPKGDAALRVLGIKKADRRSRKT